MLFASNMSRRSFPSAAVLLCALTTVLPMGLSAQPQNSKTPALASYGVWTARWWQWAFNHTAATSPFLEADAANPNRTHCAYSGLADVWFVSGTLGTPSPVFRECTVSAGARLFFPVANSFFVRDEFLIAQYGRWPLKSSKEAVKASIDNVTELNATFDGMQIPNVRMYRVESPAFAITLPPGHIFESAGYAAGLYVPAVSDGYWLMLPPLAPGKHTLRLYAQFQTGEVIDVTYTVFAK